MKKQKTSYVPEALPVLCFTEQKLENQQASGTVIPTDEECFALWDAYEMLDNIRAHSLLVAEFATALATRAVELGHPLCVKTVRASALLHDIAKSYTICHGGSHAQMGASWVVQATGNRQIAQGVALHVQWPWELPENVCDVPFFVIYADKRCMHDTCVSLSDRYEDLLERYGDTDHHKKLIRLSYEQGVSIEQALSALLECDLNAYTIDSGRLVERA